MRKLFKQLLYEEMVINQDIVLITGDLGYGMWDDVRKDFPERFFNVGAAEQLMVGMAIGMANEGKLPIVYSITPFLLYRPFELIRNYINYEKTEIVLVGSGRNKDYEHDGFSHWSEDDIDIMSDMYNIKSYWPVDNSELEDNFGKYIYNTPSYINLKR